MSTQLFGQLIEQMLQGLTPKPWASVSLHTGTPPRDPAWACARPVRFESVWDQDYAGTTLDLSYRVVADADVPPGVMEVWSGSRLLGRMPVTAFGEPEPDDIIGRIDAALEGWERGEDAMRWRPE